MRLLQYVRDLLNTPQQIDELRRENEQLSFDNMTLRNHIESWKEEEQTWEVERAELVRRHKQSKTDMQQTNDQLSGCLRRANNLIDLADRLATEVRALRKATEEESGQVKQQALVFDALAAYEARRPIRARTYLRTSTGNAEEASDEIRTSALAELFLRSAHNALRLERLLGEREADLRHVQEELNESTDYNLNLAGRLSEAEEQLRLLRAGVLPFVEVLERIVDGFGERVVDLFSDREFDRLKELAAVARRAIDEATAAGKESMIDNKSGVGSELVADGESCTSAMVKSVVETEGEVAP